MIKHRLFILLLVLISFSFSWAAEIPARTEKSPDGPVKFTRVDRTFVSQGDRLKAWFYLPSGISKPPIIVMAHGFGGQRWMRLPAYAERFAQLGMAVFIFDYRGFNDSEGEPRNYVNPNRHLQDWDAAIAYVKTLDNVDSKRMALWGTSFSGGHVVVEAAKHPEVLAVVSQVPFTDGISTEWDYIITDPIFALKGTYHGFADLVVSLFTKHRHNIRMAGRPGEAFAMMSKPDSMDGLSNLLVKSRPESRDELLKLLEMIVPDSKERISKLMEINDEKELKKEFEKEFEKQNFCPGNIAFTLGLYRPIRYADKVSCPVLVIGAEKDTLFPPSGPKKMADRMKKSTYISLLMNHFDPYVGEPFEKLVIVMGEFLKTNLGMTSTK